VYIGFSCIYHTHKLKKFTEKFYTYSFNPTPLIYKIQVKITRNEVAVKKDKISDKSRLINLSEFSLFFVIVKL
jgi:hypothetical protein